MSPNYISGVGPFEPKLMLVGEAPGKNEDEQGVPFVGASGQMVDRYLHEAGTSRSECWITNVVKFRPPLNDFKKLNLIGVDLQESIDKLWSEEIERLKPNCILAVGEHALNAVTGLYGIGKYRGSILLAKDNKTKVVPTFHPAALMAHYSADREEAVGGLSYVWSKVIQQDIRRAVEESQSNELKLTDRHLTVARNSLDVFRFFDQYAHLNKASADIESINCVPVCIGFSFNRHHAISIPLFNQIGNVKLSDMPQNEIVSCWRIIDSELRRLKLVGHNFKYDDFKLGLIGFSCPNVYSDTIIKTRVLWPELPEKKLATVASIWTREPYYKEEGKEFKLGKSRTDQLFLYNAKDCAVNIEVDEEQELDLIDMESRYQVPIRDYYYLYMMKKHKFYLEMESVGFNIDHEKKKELNTTYKAMQKEVHEHLVGMIGHDINVKSWPQKYKLLYRELGFKPYKKAPTSEESIVKLIQTHCKGKKAAYAPILETILEESRIRDQRSRNINFTPDYDGRCKTTFNISATETCRSSTGILKKPLRPGKSGLAFHTISKHGRLAKDIRSMFIPDKGKVFLQADSSQAEARVVAVLSRDWELLKAYDTIDIHRRTAGLIFGYVDKLILTSERIERVDDLEKDGPERFSGKKTRHSGGYDVAGPTFMTSFNTDAQKFGIPISISLWRANQMLDLFHAASPNIRAVFHQDIKDAIQSTRTLIDPYGGVRVFCGRMDDDIYKEGYANIPQRTIAHLVQGAGLSVWDEVKGEDVQFISENHDSLLLQVPEKEWESYTRLLKKYMEVGIDFSRYCTLKRDYVLTIPCDIEISDKSWADMKKVKL